VVASFVSPQAEQVLWVAYLADIARSLEVADYVDVVDVDYDGGGFAAARIGNFDVSEAKEEDTDFGVLSFHEEGVFHFVISSLVNGAVNGYYGLGNGVTWVLVVHFVFDRYKYFGHSCELEETHFVFDPWG